MTYVPDLLSPLYFFVVRDRAGKHVDCGFIPLTRAGELTATAIKAGCVIDLIEPNNTCH